MNRQRWSWWNCWLRRIRLDTVNHTLQIPRRHMHTHTISLSLLNTTHNLRPQNWQFKVEGSMNKWLSHRVCLKLYACHIAVSFHLIYLFDRPNGKCESSFGMKINRNLTKTNVNMYVPRVGEQNEEGSIACAENVLHIKTAKRKTATFSILETISVINFLWSIYSISILWCVCVCACVRILPHTINIRCYMRHIAYTKNRPCTNVSHRVYVCVCVRVSEYLNWYKTCK